MSPGRTGPDRHRLDTDRHRLGTNRHGSLLRNCRFFKIQLLLLDICWITAVRV